MTERDLQSGSRPDGVAGLLIDEIELKAIHKTAKGYVAMVSPQGTRQSYLVKEGDPLFDGDVVSVSSREVVFKQVVADPAASKPFREVVKSLEPT